MGYLGSAGLSYIAIPSIGNPGDVLTKDTIDWFPISWQPSGGGGGGAPATATYVVMSLNGVLTAERVIDVEPTVLTLTDNGPGATVEIGVATNGITLAKLAQINQGEFLARSAGGLGNVQALTEAQVTAMLDLFTDVLQGLVPASGGGTANFLRADGVFAVPPGAGGFAPVNAQYVTLATDGTLTNERTLAVEATVLTLTDGGAGNPVTIAVATNGITDAKLRQGAAVSVIGRSANSLGNVADIVAGGNDQIFRRITDTLNFGQLTLAMAPDDLWTFAKLQNIDTDRFLGRITAATGDIEQLTPAQATSMLDQFTDVLQGLVPASGGGTVNFLRADGAFAAPPAGAQAALQFQDEGTNLGAAGTVDTVNVTGTGVTSSRLGNVITINVPGGGGGGGTATTIEVNFGSVPVFRGRFIITDAAITPSSQVVIQQASGPYTGKGTLADEAEMDQIMCVAAPGSGQATVFWRLIGGRRPTVIPQRVERPFAVVQATGAELVSAQAPYLMRMAGRVKGNFRFTYQVFS